MPEIPLPKALIFDLDGTLYRQDAVRKAMLVRLVRAHAWRPARGLRTMRVLSAYRKAQEVLRDSLQAAPPSVNLAQAQIQFAAERIRTTPDSVAECVAHWMDQAPLDLLARNIQPGLLAFLQASQASGLRLGVLSDYPAEAKLTALGLDGFFDVVLAAQSAAVGVFKPHPRGLLVVAERLNTTPAECAYIGDRATVDGPAAVAAGMRCFIVGQRSSSRVEAPWTHVDGFPQLHALLAPQPRLNVG